MKLAGATALVTGASGGLGQAIASELAAAGARVLLTGRREDVLLALADRIGARVIASDLADRAALEELATAAGGVDVLVANAGIQAGGAFLELSPADIDRGLEVNLRAPLVLARLLADGMVARRRGHMVFVSSLSGKAASPGGSVYSATKFGLRGFALALREDLRPHGIGVSVVFPGFIRDAGMFADSGAVLPRYVGTRAPSDVGRAVARAITQDRAEVDVAPAWLRLGVALAGVAPEVAASVQRRLGAAEMSSSITARRARANGDTQA